MLGSTNFKSACVSESSLWIFSTLFRIKGPSMSIETKLLNNKAEAQPHVRNDIFKGKDATPIAYKVSSLAFVATRCALQAVLRNPVAYRVEGMADEG